MKELTNEQLEFIKGFKFLTHSNITKQNGKENGKMKNYVLLTFMNDKKEFKSIRVLKKYLDDYLIFIKNNNL